MKICACFLIIFMVNSSFMAKILLIDDEKNIRRSLREILEFEKYQIDEAGDGSVGWEMIQGDQYDLVLCDIKMPKMDGLELLKKVSESGKDTTIVMMSGHGSIDTAVEAVKKGAFDFLSKPIDLNRLLVTVRNALDKTSLISETKVLRKKVSKTGEMIGESEALNSIKEIIEKVAAVDTRILITGPNGSGKELVARAIHEKSARSTGPMVEVNCAAIPADLIESELFGHEKGAFTSAIAQRKGKFEQAEGGTLFLDEIGDMSLSAQAKVLRALQENKISRVGGDKEIRVNVRVLAATNKDLRKEIEKGNFREDLFHRLNVVPIRVPSLNERKEDIPILAEHFLQQICSEYGMPKKNISKESIKALQKIDWTGNIREFRNSIERLIILSNQNITEEDVKKFVANNKS
jgi:two-component system, NtrC family, nitrogen regulation response regulator NtrX